MLVIASNQEYSHRQMHLAVADHTALYALRVSPVTHVQLYVAKAVDPMLAIPTYPLTVVLAGDAQGDAIKVIASEWL